MARAAHRSGVAQARMSAPAPAASVVVPARDAAGSLAALLDSLAGQDVSGGMEVIVVDNASRDATGAVAAAHGARVVREERPGRARARNAGAAAARGDLLLFIDADCTADEGWAQALATCLRAPLAAGPVTLLSGDPPNAVERLERLWRFRQEERVREGWAASANLGVRRSAFEALGGFDASFARIGEDVDLCLRAAAAGHRLVYCPGARVHHPVEARVGEVLRRGVAHGWSNYQLARRHPGRAGRAGGHYHRHPGPLIRGDWALRRLSAHTQALPAAEHRRLLVLARLEYAARMVGSALAAARGVR